MYSVAIYKLLLTGQCSFEYLAQPPSTTVQDCNPYSNDGRIVITLECVVRRAIDMSTISYLIRWFRENTNELVEDLGIGFPLAQHNTDRTSSYHGTVFLNQPYSPSLLGK